MTGIQERIDTLRTKLHQAWSVLDLDAMKAEIAALEVESMAPDFWSDADRARKESQKQAELKKEYSQWEKLQSDLNDLADFVELAQSELTEDIEKDIEQKLVALEHQYTQMEFSMLFNGAHDAASAVVAMMPAILLSR
jgi:peptide chain release factor 2